MLISDIKPGMSISLEAARGVRTVEFSTTVISTEGLNVRVEPILQDGKLVGFDNGGIVLTMYIPNLQDGKLFKYMNVTVRSYKAGDGSLFQEITCKTEEAKAANRRGACRVWVGETGIAQINDDPAKFPAIVKDISSTGVGLVVDDKPKIGVGDILMLSFEDTEAHSKFSLGATVIRQDEVDSNHIVYGCKFKQSSDAISKYVNEKQRVNLRKTRTVNAANNMNNGR